MYYYLSCDGIFITQGLMETSAAKLFHVLLSKSPSACRAKLKSASISALVRRRALAPPELQLSSNRKPISTITGFISFIRS